MNIIHIWNYTTNKKTNIRAAIDECGRNERDVLGQDRSKWRSNDSAFPSEK